MSDIGTSYTPFTAGTTPAWQVPLPAVAQPAPMQQSPLGTDQLKLSSLVTGGAAPAPVTPAPVATVSGAAPTDPQAYSQFVASTIAMLNSGDPKQQFQSVINMTKMQPAEAVPLLQQASQNANPQVVQLAQQALNVMQQLPATANTTATTTAPAATTAPATTPPATATPATTPTTPPPATPAAPTVSSGAQVQALATQISDGTDQQAIQAVLQLEQLAGSDRQDVVSTLLKQIDASNFVALPSDAVKIAAISSLKDLNASEAVPVLQSVLSNNAFSSDVHNAAASAIQAMAAQGGSAGTVSQDAQLQALASQIGTSSDQQGIQAILQMEQLAGTDRAGVVSTLLKQIDMRNFMNLPSAAQQEAAISALKDLHATEAVPYLTVICSTNSFDPAVKSAAAAALQQIQAPAATPGVTAPASTGLPAATLPAVPAYPQAPVAPVAPVSQAPTVPVPGANPGIPSFLQH